MTNDTADDQKLCPYCAETIKAAAIKCRYCQSDLRGVVEERASATVVEERAPAPVVEERTPASVSKPVSQPRAGAETDWDDGGFEMLPKAASPPSRSFLAGPVLTAVLAVVALGLAVACIVVQVVAGDDGTAPDGTLISDDARAVALSQATDLTERMLSYDFKNFDKVRKSNTGRMSDSFAKQYDQGMAKAESKTRKFQLTLQTKVVASGLQSVTVHEAKVLLFINQTTTAKSGADKTPTTELNRTVVTMVRGDGDWRVDKIDPLVEN